LVDYWKTTGLNQCVTTSEFEIATDDGDIIDIVGTVVAYLLYLKSANLHKYHIHLDSDHPLLLLDLVLIVLLDALQLNSGRLPPSLVYCPFADHLNSLARLQAFVPSTIYVRPKQVFEKSNAVIVPVCSIAYTIGEPANNWFRMVRDR
jgi:hypothetical protein